MMKAIAQSRVDLQEFLEIVLMWHTSGDTPLTRPDMTAFIEAEHFGEFMMSTNHWASRFGVSPPSRASVVKTLYTLCSC